MPATGKAMAKLPRMLAEERRRKILEFLEKEHRVTVGELVKRLGVSAVTTREDLDVLSDRGALVRSHGGAVRRLDPVQDYPLKFKETIHHAEKVRIGHMAARMVRPNQTIILDSGTTTVEIARHLRAMKVSPLTVITNGLNIALELADTAQITLIMIGGILRPISYSFVGPQAARMLQELHADHFFLAVDGFDPEVGPSTPDILEAQLNAVMIQVAREVTVVADASKLGRRSLSLIGGVEQVHRIVTDARIQPELVARLRGRGVEVLIA
jgi:DeoR family transcriptional regulator, aga operon transcriptional repressor